MAADYQVEPKENDCQWCEGTGICRDCEGKSSSQIDSEKFCETCAGLHKCLDCDGTGRIHE